MTELHAHEGRVTLRLRALFMGDDLCVLLDGGDKAHTGAVALASETLAQPSCFCLPGHREGELAQELASILQQRLKRTVTVLCGIHVDTIQKEEIKLVLRMAQELAHELAQKLELELAQGHIASPCPHLCKG